MTNPIHRNYNSETGEIVDREMTDAEYAEFLAYEAALTAPIATSEA